MVAKAKKAKAGEGINARLALVIKSGKVRRRSRPPPLRSAAARDRSRPLLCRNHVMAPL
jgi:hypothetical protein